MSAPSTPKAKRPRRCSSICVQLSREDREFLETWAAKEERSIVAPGARTGISGAVRAAIKLLRESVEPDRRADRDGFSESRGCSHAAGDNDNEMGRPRPSRER